MIDANITRSAAKNLKHRIYFAINDYKNTGKDIKLVENIKNNETQGDLKKNIGFISLLVNCRIIFSAKKI